MMRNIPAPDSDSEDELGSNWQERVTQNGMVYYVKLVWNQMLLILRSFFKFMIFLVMKQKLINLHIQELEKLKRCDWMSNIKICTYIQLNIFNNRFLEIYHLPGHKKYQTMVKFCLLIAKQINDHSQIHDSHLRWLLNY